MTARICTVDGCTKPGRASGPRKLTEDDKTAILARIREGVSAARLADEFGVNERTIYRYRAQVAS